MNPEARSLRRSGNSATRLAAGTMMTDASSMRSYAHSVAWSLRSAILEGNEYSATRRVLSPGALEHVASPGAPCITHIYIHMYI